MTNITIMVRNRFRLTKQCLESLGMSGTEDAPITVMDDRSEPETTDFVKWWCDKNGAYYFRNETPMGTGPLRNLVIRESARYFGKGEYLAPHDNDTFFCRGWLQVMIECYARARQHGFRLLGGTGHPYHIPIASVPLVELHREIQEVQALSTQSQLMEWETYERIGEFVDTPVDKTCQSEDVAWTNILRSEGYRLGVVSPYVIHKTALKNTFGEPGPGWKEVQAECPEGILCE